MQYVSNVPSISKKIAFIIIHPPVLFIILKKVPKWNLHETTKIMINDFFTQEKIPSSYVHTKICSS